MTGKKINQIDRRGFLKAAAAGAAGCAFLGTGGCETPLSAGGARRARRPTDEIRVAVAGLRVRGGAHLEQLVTMRDARIVALCDVDSAILAGRVRQLDKHGIKVAAHVDFRRILEMPDVDAVVLATPNHWHTLQTIWACQAGKDVYVEKPVSHNLFESRQLAVVAARYGRVVQAGTQNRSDDGLIPAFDYIRRGNLGRIKLIRGVCYRLRASIGRANGPQQPPASVNYDLWCGPAPLEPLHRLHLHYDWHWIWHTGNGEIGNQGPHELDLIRWVLGDPPLPPHVISLGGRVAWDDDGQTPNTQLAFFDFPEAPVVFDVFDLPMKKGVDAPAQYRNLRTGLVVECEGGSFAGGRGGGKVYDTHGKIIKDFPGDGGEVHMSNFFKAIRSRNNSILHAPVANSAISAGLTHFANLSYRTGATAPPDEIAERIKSHPGATDTCGRMLERLKLNEVDLKRWPLTLGGWLAWDNNEYRFTDGANHEAANALITRDYRAPFVVPDLRA